MKKWYCVVSSFYNDGIVIANMVDVVQARQKPESEFKETSRCDIYTDWFGSRKEAENWIHDSLNC